MPTIGSSYPVARKAHSCLSCGAGIAAGERYYRWYGTNDAWTGLATLKECAACCVRYGRPIPDSAASEREEGPHA